MVTGCNSGIGKHTALELGRRGGTVHMVCRNPETAAEARAELVKATGNEKYELHILDLSRPRDVLAFVDRFSSSEGARSAVSCGHTVKKIALLM